MLLGRKYQHLCFKDDTLWFYATESLAHGDNAQPDGFPLDTPDPTAPSTTTLTPSAVQAGAFVELPVDVVCDIMADVNSIKDSGKRMARKQLLLSQTVDIPDVSSQSLYYMDDIWGEDTQGRPVCMTDGGSVECTCACVETL